MNSAIGLRQFKDKCSFPHNPIAEKPVHQFVVTLLKSGLLSRTIRGNRLQAKGMGMKPEPLTSVARWLKAVLVVTVLILLSVGAWFYQLQKEAMQQEVEKDLITIARLG